MNCRFLYQGYTHVARTKLFVAKSFVGRQLSFNLFREELTSVRRTVSDELLNVWKTQIGGLCLAKFGCEF